jgi:hypothetical protein
MPPLFGPVIYGEHRPQSGATTKHPEDRQELNPGAVALPLESKFAKSVSRDALDAVKTQVKRILSGRDPACERDTVGVSSV